MSVAHQATNSASLFVRFLSIARSCVLTSAQGNRKAGLRGETHGWPGSGLADNGRVREVSRAEIDEVIETYGAWSAALVTNIE